MEIDDFIQVIGRHVSEIFEEADKVDKILKGPPSPMSNPFLFSVRNGQESKTRV